MTIDKQKLQKLLWAEAASYRADCADWKRNTEALQEFLGEKTLEEVALELLAENERQAAQFKEWQASHHANYCTVADERDQLKAENEALRKALGECVDSLRGEVLQKFGGQLPDDMHPVTRREYDRDMAEVDGYRAAMGKGEQS